MSIKQKQPAKVQEVATRNGSQYVVRNADGLILNIVASDDYTRKLFEKGAAMIHAWAVNTMMTFNPYTEYDVISEIA